MAKQVSPELRDVTKMQQELWENMLQGVVVQDTAGAITYANPRALEILGLTLDQMQGRTSFDPHWRAVREDGTDFPGEDHPAMSALRSGKVVRNVMMGVYHPEKERYSWICVNAVPVIDKKSNEVSHVFTTFDDHTDSWLGEEILAQSKEFYKADSVLSSISDGLFVMDNEWKIIYLNAVAVKFGFGLKEALIGKILWGIMPDVKPYFDQFHRAKRENVTVHFEAMAAGTNRWVEVHAYPSMQGLSVIFRDITEKKESETRFQRLFENMQVSFSLRKIIVGESGEPVDLEYVQVNPAFEKLWGISAADVVGRRITEAFSGVEKDDPDWIRLLTAVARTGQSMNREHYRRATGLFYQVSAYSPEPGLVAVVASDITDNKRYESLMATMPDGFAYCKMIYENGAPEDLVYLAVNDAFMKLTGLKDVVGKRVTEVIPGHKEANPELFEIYGRVARTGRSEQFEMYVKPLNRWLSISVSSHGDGHFMAIFDNISDRKKVEIQLQQSEERFRAVLDSSLDVAYRRNIQTDAYDYLSPAMESISGYSVQEWLDMPTETVISNIHPDDLDLVSSTIEESMAGSNKVSYHLEYRFKHRDGDYRWFEDLFVLVADSCGNPLYRVGGVRDITKRKHMEEALIERELRYRMLFDNVNDAIILLEIDSDGQPGKFMDVNDITCRRLGYSREELLGLSIKDISVQNESTSSLYFSKVQEEQNVTFETTHKAKDGTLIPVEQNGRYFTMGGVSYILYIARDLTERKRAERQLRTSYTRMRRNDLLNKLIAADNLSEQQVSEILVKAGFVLSGPLVCCLVELQEWMGKSRDYWKQHLEKMHYLQDGIIDLLNDDDRCLAWTSPDGLGVLHCGTVSDLDAKGYQLILAAELKGKVERSFEELTVQIGVSELSTKLNDVHTQYHQCCSAIKLGKNFWPEQSIYNYLDMGVFQVFPFSNKEQITAYIDRTLGKLLQYKSTKDVDYIMTLEALLESRNLADTAKKLFVHQKTLDFRRRRIEQIMEISLDSFDTRMALAMALKLMKLEGKTINS